MAKYEEPIDEDVEEFEIPEGEGDEEETRPINRRETVASVGSVLAAMALFSGTAWRTGRGMFGTNPVTSRYVIAAMLIVSVGVFFYSGYALKLTRPHEGTVIRGLALTATVLSALSFLILGTSLATLISAASGH